MTKRIFTSVFSFAFVLFIFWLGGGDFVRGLPFAYTVLFAASAGVLAYLYPGWEE